MNQTEKVIKAEKFYNPYPFPVRVKNDQGEDQIIASQDRGKTLGGKYGPEQSPLKLFPYDIDRVARQKKVKGLGKVELRRIVKADLVKLAWAMCIDGDLLKKQNRDIIELIKAKVQQYEESKTEEQTPPEVKEDEAPEAKEDEKSQ